MALLKFPGVGAPYRGFISEMRTQFQIIANKVRNSPGNAEAVNAHIAVLAAATGFTPELPANQAIVTNGASFPVDGGTVTLTVTGGVVSAAFESEE